jgi:hypothetical protein
MLRLNYDAAHRFVSTNPNAVWNGWDIELFKATPSGYTNKHGAYRNGNWGIVQRISPNAQGMWVFKVR